MSFSLDTLLATPAIPFPVCVTARPFPQAPGTAGAPETLVITVALEGDPAPLLTLEAPDEATLDHTLAQAFDVTAPRLVTARALPLALVQDRLTRIRHGIRRAVFPQWEARAGCWVFGAARSAEDLRALVREWEADPAWDLEETEGFEAHVEGLRAYREAQSAAAHAARIAERRVLAERLGCPGNLALAAYVYDLESRLATLEARVETLMSTG